MSLLSPLAGGLLDHRRLRFTCSRRGAETRDGDTGAPIPGAMQDASITGWLTWMTTQERADYKGDASAYILTTPGSLLVGDILTGAGNFEVLAVKPHGDFDRADLKRA